MKSVGKFAVVLLTLTIFASPLMACLQPESALTDEERECCRQMAGDCEGMPSSHSCCKLTVRDSDPYLNSSRFSISEYPPQDALAVLPIIKIIDLPESVFQSLVFPDAHAPPESPPFRTSILRI